MNADNSAGTRCAILAKNRVRYRRKLCGGASPATAFLTQTNSVPPPSTDAVLAATPTSSVSTATKEPANSVYDCFCREGKFTHVWDE
jgi:hypothetical protein